jgi:hypothetical protein
MLKRASLFVLASGLTVSTLMAADISPSRTPRSARDANRLAVDMARAEEAARQALDWVMAQEDLAAAIAQGTEAPGDLCAIARIPGPRVSADIRLSIRNMGSADIVFANVNSFLALGGRSLIVDEVFAATPPPGGTLTVEYPAGGGGVGPAVLSFTGFGPQEDAAFNLDPDTYDNPSFGATVFQMNRTIIEVAYDDGRRCRGALAFNAGANASVALLTQTSP